MKKPIFFLISLFITIPCIADYCLSETAPEYEFWVQWGMPSCWCYPQQCRGDTNGSSFFGKPVTVADLNLFKLCFNKRDSELTPECICADFDHNGFFDKRITLGDLGIFKRYFDKPEAMVPPCNEEPIYTGPYNYWETP